MSKEVDRNREFVYSINTDKINYLKFFVTDMDNELDNIGRTLDTDSSKILLNWVRDKLYKLHREYDANV